MLLLVPGGIVLVVLLAFAALSNGVGGEQLRLQAERSLSTIAGRPLEVSFGGTGLGFHGFSLLAVGIKDARISDPQDAKTVFEAGDLSFGVQALPLLTGNLRLGGARLTNGRIDLSRSAPGGAAPLAAILDPRGLIDPDRVEEEFFLVAQMLFEAIDDGITDAVELRNVEIRFGETPSSILLVKEARLDRSTDKEVALRAEVRVAGVPVRIEGAVSRPDVAQAVSGIEIAIEFGEEGEQSASIEGMPKSGRFVLSGHRSAAGDSRMALTADLAGTELTLPEAGTTRLDVSLSAYTSSGLGKLEVSELSVSSGRSRWQFHGAIGAVPAGAGDPAYRFEFISDRSHVAPEGALEPSLDVVARLLGTIGADGRLLSADEFTVRTSAGEVQGKALVTFDPWQSPGLDLELRVAGFPVGSAKQLWPWFAAPGAWQWAHQNLFGGRVTEGRLDISIAPGRLLDGEPTLPGEIVGDFSVERVRFDVAGRIPAVREGIGRIVFDGPVVDISLESGTVFLGSGRTVQASGGTFHINAERGRRLVGELDMDVAGEAAAIVELASYDPINATSFIELGPEDFEGDVTGKIVADIPLEAGVSHDELEWMVVLDYKNLALSKPFQNYTISDASGSILVEPRRVVIDAETQLDGMLARVYLIEPMDGSDTDRRQEVSLRINDTTRDRLVPGLATFLSGSADVEMRGGADRRREIGVDLAASRLSVPWAGWSKGSGIPAMASFVMENSGDRTVLDDFALEGDTFSVFGSLELAEGELETARFHDVRFNRGDNFSVDVVRSGRGYSIDISGRSLDARSLVRHLTEESEPGGQTVEGVPIRLEMRLEQVVGFHDEIMRNVRLTYGGTGSKIESLVFSATTSGGQPVHFRHDTVDGSRNITMQSTDAGAVVRFLDLYERMQGGSIELALSGRADGPLSGHVDARDFWLVDEPRLGSLVSTTPQGSDRSLNQAVRGQVDVSRVRFDRGYAEIGKSPGYLSIGNGVLRGAQIGTTFRGVLYDANGNMDISGTFLPAYGLNRIFGEIPLFGQILGNGRDGGLIGVTYRLAGKAGEPQLQVNPLSAVAPGIFRSVFEFN